MATAGSNEFQLEVPEDRVCVEWGSGFTVTCHLSPKISAADMEIRWFKGTDCVCVYKNSQVIEGRRYEDRLKMIYDDLKSGNVSLNLTQFIDSDEGDYLCQVISGDRTEEVTIKIKIFNKRRGAYTLWTFKQNKKWTEEERIKMDEESLMTENHTLQMKDVALKENVSLLKRTINELEQTTREVEKKQNQLEEKDTQLKNISKQMTEKEKLLESTIKEMETNKQQLETLTKELEKQSMQLQGMVIQLEEQQKVPHSDLRLVLLGASGYGKSTVGNMILGIEKEIQIGTSTEIQQSVSRQGEAAGRKLTVVETPDWFCSGLSLEDVRQDAELCVRLSAPGPHTFLFVIPVKESAGGMLEKMEEIFGERCWRNTIILFTVSDEKQEKNIEEFVQSGNQEVQRLVEKCENRFHCLNIDQSGDNFPVSQLMEKIDKMVAGNTETFYSSEIYLQINEMAKKIVKELKKIKERQHREVSKKLDGEMQEALHRFRSKIKLLYEHVSQIEERITQLERKIKEEKHEEIIKELERELEREKQQRQMTEDQLRESKEQWEKERSEMEERHRQEVEKIKETCNQDLMKMVMAKFQIILSDIFFSMTEEHKIMKVERKTLKQKLGKSKSQSKSGEKEDVIETSAAPIKRNSMDEPPKLSAEASPPELGSELRLVLLGRSESGKRAAGNIILGREEGSHFSTSTEIQKSESRQGEVAGRKVKMVETPDWFCSGLSLEELRQDVKHCVCQSTPGPHAFLLVIPVQESTGEERGMQEKLEVIFGERCWRNIVILFTVTEEKQEKNIEEFVHSGNPEVQRLVEKCGYRFHCLNINQSEDDSQVPQLLQKIELMIGGNTERFYSSEIYLETESQIREMEEQLMREREERNRISSQVEDKDREIEYLKSIISEHTETQENRCGLMNWFKKLCCCCCPQSYETVL
ncbi:GTPase IMAP family member 8-like [Garra rufa]|uniref:GTPase IMAP family member 8-like n=1 Tax=Garra rufa TaxID=137080 RepID=UPI003CCEAC8C